MSDMGIRMVCACHEIQFQAIENLSLAPCYHLAFNGETGMQPQKALASQAQPRKLFNSMTTRASRLYEIHHVDAFEWLASAPMDSIEAVVTDPPYGLVEYSDKELTKLKNGKGGI